MNKKKQKQKKVNSDVHHEDVRVSVFVVYAWETIGLFVKQSVLGIFQKEEDALARLHEAFGHKLTWHRLTSRSLECSTVTGYAALLIQQASINRLDSDDIRSKIEYALRKDEKGPFDEFISGLEGET